MLRRSLFEVLIIITVVAVAAAFAHFVESGAVREMIVRLCSIGLFAVSLNLLVGYAGLLSFGHALFLGLGAYTFALLLQSGAVGIPVAIFATLTLTLIAATAIGAICVRLTHIYFAFLTLAIQMLFYSLLIAWSGLTGGEQGLIGGVPKPPFLGIDLTNPSQYFMFNIVVFVVSLLVLRRVVLSPFGAALRMIRDNPQRAIALGVDVPRTKLTAFVIASMFSSIAGILLSLYVSGAYPNFAHWTMSAEGLFMIMLGGARAFLGPLVGAVLLLILESLVNAFTRQHGYFVGATILIFALGLRRGILDVAIDRWGRWKRGRSPDPIASQTELTVGPTFVRSEDKT